MRKKKYNLSFKVSIFLTIIFLALFLLIGYIWKVLTTSDYFCIKKIIVRNSDLSFDYLKGKNIFNLDLSEESQRTFLKCLDCRRVRLTRALPDCIVVDFLKRQPVALVKLYKNFAVDAQGILFYPGADIQQEALPLIYGLQISAFTQKKGGLNKYPALSLALNIIKEFKANKAFKGFVLNRIDVVSLASGGFFIFLPRPADGRLSGFEVRIGSDNIKQKMMILGGLVIQARKDWQNIKYIDLRFKEPLIKLNNNL